MARRRPTIPTATEKETPRGQRNAYVRESETIVSSSTYQEKYRTCKRKIKELEQATETTLLRVQQAKKEIVRLQRIGSKYLTQLVERQATHSTDSSSVTSESEIPLSYLTNKARVPKPSSFADKPKPLKATASSAQPATKKKTLTGTSKPKRVHPIPRDKDGNFVLPVQVGIFTILNLGTVDYRRPSFHTHRYIYPIGFKIQRYYKSTVHQDAQACYTVEILDGDQGPRFEITADDRPNEPFTSETSSGVWSQIIKLSNQIRQLKITNSGSGPEFTGFSHPTIAWMIQCLPNVDRCKDYRWQEFEVMSLYQVSTRKWEAPPLPGTTELTKDEEHSDSDVDKSPYGEGSASMPKYESNSS